MAFGQSPRWSIGVEEELLLVDERTFEPVAAAPLVVARNVDGLKYELFQSMIETTTGICESPDDAVAGVRAARERTKEVAADLGLRVVAAGAHPFAKPEDQPIVDNPDYLEFVAFAGPAARRQGVQGLHVHVGMPDADVALRALEGALPWLPVVLAVAANSPFFRGEETGFLSTRAEVLATLPRSGAPPPFESFDDWTREMERWRSATVIRRYSNVWWDARINPEFGTVEIRIADQPTDVDVVAKVVAAVHALVVRAADGEPAPTGRIDYQTNRFAAARFGPRARLIWGDRLVPVSELAAEIDLPAVCEADRQLDARDDLFGLCRDLAART